MAERRMMTRKVTDDDHFLSLSSSAQALYLHLMMSADDDGFNNQVTIAMFRAHASVQDLQALLEARYIYQFEDGVIVIRHWRMANALRKDRYTPTAFQKELKSLRVDERGVYCEGVVAERLPDGCQMVATLAPQDRLGKDSVGKDIKRVGRFAPPTHDELVAYAAEKHLTLDADRFLDYYSSNGWMVGRTHMKDWKAAARNWARRDAQEAKPRKTSFHNFEERESAGGDWSELETFQPDDDEPDDDESWKDLLSGFKTAGKRKEDT